MRRTIFISLCFAAAALLSAFCTEASAAQRHFVIRGCVMLRDSVDRPAEHVMVYSSRHGIGTMTDASGRYSLSVPKVGSVKLEYAIMGWKTEYLTLNVAQQGVTAADTVFLTPQPLMLSAAYLTADGEPPAKFILRQVWKKADENRKRLSGYEASVNYNIASHGIPEVAGVLSWFKMGLLKLAAGRFGYGPLLRHIINNDNFYAKAALERKVVGSRTTDTDNRLLESNSRLPKNVESNILSMFESIDLYNMLYGEKKDWGRKFAANHDFELIGTYIYGDRLVDILSWQNQHSDIKVTVHVVEELWGILKLEIGRGKETIICEARDVGGGIYMPICFAVKPEITLIKAEEIPGLIEDLENNRRMDKKMTKRTVAILKEHLGSDYNPYISVGYNVEYSKVSLKK